MDIHKGVRNLRVGGTLADPIQHTGSSIMAGCTNSTSLSRAYIKRITRGLEQGQDEGHLLFEHVDDLAQLFFAKSERQVRNRASIQIGKLAKLVEESRLTLSSKSVLVSNPPQLATRVASLVKQMDIQL